LTTLTPRQLDRLFELVTNFLRDSPLGAPFAGEREPLYAARVLQPALANFVRSLDVHGLLVAGEGAGPPRPVYHLGLQFFPDITVHRQGARLIAIEVKYCRGFDRQDQVAKAMGQALIYRLCGYQRSGVLVIDFESKVRDADLFQANARQAEIAEISIIVRRKSGRLLTPHPNSDSGNAR